MHSHGDLKVKILWPRLKSMKEEAFDEKKELQGSRTCIALNQVLKLPEGNCIHKFKNELSYVSVPLLLFIEKRRHGH